MKSSQNAMSKFRVLCLYIFLISFGIIFIFPLLWMVSTALKTAEQTYTYPPTFFPKPITFQHFIDCFKAAPLGVFIKNSAIVTSLSVLGTMVSASMVAFAFGRLKWVGRDTFFMILLATMMIPSQVTMIPVFLIFHKIGWVNTLKPLILPSFLCGGTQGAFYVFMLRQFIMIIPRELDEAATIDGCNYFQIFYRIMLPLLRPALGAVVIFAFMEHWNEFMNALIYLNDTMKFTLPIGLQYFRADDYINWNRLMAASLLALLPCVLVFFFGQKVFMQGISFSTGKDD